MPPYGWPARMCRVTPREHPRSAPVVSTRCAVRRRSVRCRRDTRGSAHRAVASPVLGKRFDSESLGLGRQDEGGDLHAGANRAAAHRSRWCSHARRQRASRDGLGRSWRWRWRIWRVNRACRPSRRSGMLVLTIAAATPASFVLQTPSVPLENAGAKDEPAAWPARRRPGRACSAWLPCTDSRVKSSIASTPTLIPATTTGLACVRGRTQVLDEGGRRDDDCDHGQEAKPRSPPAENPNSRCM